MSKDREHWDPAALLAACCILAAIALMAWMFLMPYTTPDIEVIQQWYQQILQQGVSSLGEDFTTYTPPYTYMLVVGSLITDLPDIAVIKIIPSIFNPLAAVLIGLTVLRVTGLRERAMLSGFGFLLLPTALLNSARWGQMDIIHTTCLLAFFIASLKRNSVATCLWFGLAISFKPQAVVVAPYLLFLLIEGDVRWRDLAFIPLTYMVLMIPSWLAGRSWLDLLLIYPRFIGNHPSLWANAPNLYFLVDELPAQKVVLTFGLAISAAIGLALVFRFIRLKKDARPEDVDAVKLVAAAASALYLPYFLPKMHDRYFFVADVLTYVLAVVRPRFVPIALAVQAGSISAYLRYLFGWQPGMVFGAVFMTAAVVMMGVALSRQPEAFRPAMQPSPS